MKKIVTTAISTILVTLLTIGIVWAQKVDNRTPEQKAHEFRDGLFHTIEWKMGQMVGAKMRKDKAAFQKHAADMAYLAGMIPEGFALKNSLPEGTRAKPEIWQDWDTFTEKAGKFKKAAQALASSGDIDGFDPKKFGGGNCGACHKDFKTKEE